MAVEAEGPPMVPELVFFDVGDTLIRPEPSWADVYLGVCRNHGIDVDREQLQRAMLEATKQGAWSFEGPFDATREGSYERVRSFDDAVMTQLGRPDLPDDFFRALGRAFSALDSWHVFPDVLPCLDALESAGIRRAVISNWVWEADELLHTLDLAPRFERLIISARVGYQKPHRQIFERALAETGVDPRRAVHVGDNYTADVLGARATGIAAVLLRRDAPDPARLTADLPEGETVPVVRDLFGLLDLFGLRSEVRAAHAAGPRE